MTREGKGRSRAMAGDERSLSLGSRILPGWIRARLPYERFPVQAFVRREVLPLLSEGMQVLDAGSGRIAEQDHREEFLATGCVLKTLDLCGGEGVDVVGDVAAIPFGDGTFDFVLCTQVLEHVPDPRKVCAELFRVVKAGGRLAVTAPQSAPLHNLPYHYFHFTKIGLRMILEEAGFEVLAVQPQGGHFHHLAMQLHFTARVLSELSGAGTGARKLLLWPFLLLSRVMFGFVLKLPAGWLDRTLPYEGNAQGWCFLCRKGDGRAPEIPSAGRK